MRFIYFYLDINFNALLIFIFEFFWHTHGISNTLIKYIAFKNLKIEGLNGDWITTTITILYIIYIIVCLLLSYCVQLCSYTKDSGSTYEFVVLIPNIFLSIHVLSTIFSTMSRISFHITLL